MSWHDNINNNQFTIITGDGKSWYPKWKNATKDIEFNASIFEFVNVEGSLALRQKPKGRKFDIEIYFDGENCIDVGNSFEFSTRDSRSWTVKHPFYGDIICQPLTLKQDNSVLNISRFDITIIETITDLYPQSTPVFEDQIIDQSVITNESQAQSLEQSKELDKVELKENVNSLDVIFSKIIVSNDDFKAFKTAVSDAIIEIDNISSTGLSILRTIQSIINYPAMIEQTVEARINVIKEAINNLKDTFSGNKNQFEAVAGGLMVAMFLASVTNITEDYAVRNQIINRQIDLTNSMNDYIEFLDSIQTDRADSDDSYIPNFNSINNLTKLSGLTISNLYYLIFSAKQEREYTLDNDSNPILLTHKFYGLDKNDVNLNKLINTNNIGLNELLNIRKGRKILYYV